MIKNVKVGCYEFEVIETEDPIIIENNSNYSGCVDYHDIKIKIMSKLANSYKYQILWHELLHVLISYFDIDFKNDNEEKIIDCLARGILMILKDNEFKMKED